VLVLPLLLPPLLLPPDDPEDPGLSPARKMGVPAGPPPPPQPENSNGNSRASAAALRNEYNINKLPD
jgi:hypothetical protein